MSWPLVRLGDVVAIDTRMVAPESIREGTSYIGLESIGAGGAIDESVMVAAGELKSAKFAYDERHILFGKLRPNLGKVARPSKVGVCSTDILPLLPSEKLDRNYLAHFLLTPASIALAASRTSGANLPRLTGGVLKTFEIPLPPLPEQRRIASILDAVDSLRVARRKALREVNRLPGEVFDQLFGPEVLNVPICDLGDLVAEGTSVTYGIVQAGPEAPGGVPYIRTGDIVEGGIRLAGLRLTSPEIASRFPRSTVRAGEIVMSIRATVGTTALVPEELDGANLTQGTARIAPGPNLEAVYLLGFLRSRQAQAWIRAQVKGATFREITLGRLRELPVPVPHRDLQRRYVRDFELIQSAKCAHESQLVKLDELFASLQYRAFRGEL